MSQKCKSFNAIMQTKFLILAYFAIISTANSNVTDKDELWALLLNGKLNQISTKTTSEVTAPGALEDAAIHSQAASTGNINYESHDKASAGIKSEEDFEQLFDSRDSAAEDGSGGDVTFIEEGNSVSTAAYVDDAFGGEIFDDSSEMQADSSRLDDEIIDVLRNKSASREMLGLLGFLKERKETDIMRQQLSKVYRPISERFENGLSSILEDHRELSAVPAEEVVISEPIQAESLIDNAADRSASVNSILIPELSNEISNIRKSYEIPQEGQRSLVIVFDATGSMLDDLQQLREGAKLIISEISELKNNPIYNYVFVPFRDPRVGPRLVTRNKEELLQALENLQIFGGGDCPEAALAAIAEAIEAALPNSFVFVFTDATAKDFKLDGRVLRLVQQKQTPITFLLTGFCDGKNTAGHKVMNDIAAASNGQIYDLKKDQIEHVLLSIRGMLNVDHVPLKAVDSPKAETHNIDLNVDHTLKEFSVSVAGRHPNIQITDPNFNPYSNSKPLLDLENIKVVNVAEPTPGKWNIRAGSNSSHSVRLSGNSEIKFKFGFSQSEPSSFSTTARQPVLNIDNILTIQPTQPDLITNLTQVVITSHDTTESGGTKFNFTLPLRKILLNDSSAGFSTPVFQSPRQRFKISVIGQDIDGYPLDRLISTAIQAIGLSAPELIVDLAEVELLEGDNFSVKCHVQSVTPVLVQWMRFNRPLVEGKFNSTDTLALQITNATIKNSGRYTCRAVNSIGEQETTTTIKVKPKPEPSIGVYPKDIVAYENERLIALRCITKNISPLANIVWSFNGVKIDNAVGREYLELHDIKPSDEGTYECRIEHDGNILGDSTTIIVEFAPKTAGKKIDTISAAYGLELVLECGLEGNPKPTYTWLYRSLDEQQEKHLPKTEYELKLSDIVPEVEGFYVCEARNRHGTSRRTILVQGEANEPPKIPKPEVSTLYVKPGAQLVLNCSCDLCQPLAEYIWTTGRRLTFESSPYDVQDNARVNLNVDQTRNAIDYQLTIDNFEAADQGPYNCILSNAHGADSIAIDVRLMQAPKVEGILVDDQLQVVQFLGIDNAAHNLTCDTIGLPEPHIRWYRNDEILTDNEHYALQNENKTLSFIKNFGDFYSATYKCVASNPLGSSTSQLLVQYGEQPQIITQLQARMNIELGDVLSLDCVTTGTPQPNVTWYFNHNIIVDKFPFITALEHSGIYTCNASNTFGHASSSATVVVFSKPFMLNVPEDIAVSVSQHTNVSLECTAGGFPKPDISWMFNEKPIAEILNAQILDTGLLLHNVSTQNQGSYICNAENVNGATQKVFYLVVKEPPNVTSDIPKRVELLPNQQINLECAGEGNPPPLGIWIKDKIPLESHGTLNIRYATGLSGNYTCALQNEEGIHTKSVEIILLTPPNRSENISSTELTLKAEVNAPLTLVCPFDNYDDLFWQLNEKKLDKFVDLTDVQLLENILYIEKLRKVHEGTYTCFVENRAGRDQYSFIVGILSPPEILDNKQSFGSLRKDIDPDSENNIAEVSLLSGEELRLTCHASGSPLPVVSWLKDDKAITRGTELTIDNVDTHHNGVYTCVAVNDLGTATKFYRLDVMTSPRYWGNAVDHVEVYKDDDLQLECGMEANPPPTIQWMKDDFILDEFENELDFTAIQPQDSGVYTCEAENIFGAEEKKFHVTVYQSPTITFFLDSRTATSGEALNIVCEAVGNPLPILSIIHKGEVLASTSDLEYDSLAIEKMYSVKPKGYYDPLQQFLVTKISPFEIQFTFVHVNASANAVGKYLCHAQNAIGYDERLTKVDIFVPPHVQKLKSNTPHSVLQGLPLYLNCPITGNPKPNLSWTHNNKPIKFNGQTLFITSTTAKHAGNYTCFGENTVGRYNLTFAVDILLPPTMINSIHLGDDEPADQPDLEEISILSGEDVTLDCASLGNPQPDTYWTKVVYLDEKRNERINSKDPVLELYGIRDTSTYSCYVNNSAGSTQKLFHIVVQTPPSFQKIEYDAHPSVSLHHSLDLNCEVEGVPEADVIWTKDEIAIKDKAKGYFLAANGHILRILGARLSDAGEYKCVGHNLHGQVSREFYVTVDVPVSWSPWGEWSPCSATCGKGTKFRSRICLLPSGSPALGDQYNCVGENVQEKDCEMLPCPINGGWGTWTKWSNCSLECLTEYNGLKSYRYRSRKCDNPPPSLGGKPCVGEQYEEELCNVKFCSIDGGWTPWTNWTPCSETCGFGRTIRMRSCSEPAPKNGGKPCQGSESEIKICKLRECTVNGGWSEWGPWSKCSKLCGAGVRIRKRSCTKPEPKNGGRQCKGENAEVEKCFIKACRNDALLKTLSRNTKQKYSPLLTYESKYPKEPDTDEDDEYDENYSPNETHPFQVVRRYEYAEALPVEYVDMPVETLPNNNEDDYHTITVSLKNTVNLTKDTVDYHLNINGVGSTIEYNCAPGLVYNYTQSKCIDINECSTEKHICTGEGQICVNTKGGYECLCIKGYRMVGDHCVDVNECRDSSHECSHFCVNNPGGYSCFCPTSFLLAADEKTCTKRRTREQPMFSIMNYAMICPEGYQVEGEKCVDTDECLSKEDECNEEQTCLNTKGSYLCVPTGCPEGYDADDILGKCYQSCESNLPGVCADGAQIEQTLTYRVITLKKFSPKLVLATLAIPAFQRASVDATFSFLERTYAHTFSLVPTPSGSGAIHLYANKKFQRGKIYKIKLIAHAYGIDSGVMDYAHRFVVYIYCPE